MILKRSISDIWPESRLCLADSGLAPGRLDSLDQLRGLAILLVLVFHGGGVLKTPTGINGEIGVDVFLLISGFSLALGSFSLPWKTFLWRRIYRIFPAYWVALMGFYFLHGYVLNLHAPRQDLYIHLLGLHGLGHDGGLFLWNDSFWFIGLIVPLYFIAFAIKRWVDRVDVLVFVCGLATYALFYRAMHHGDRAILDLATMRIPVFFLGIAAGRLFAGGTLKFGLNPLLMVGGALLYYLFSHQQLYIGRACLAIAVIFGGLGLFGTLGTNCVTRPLGSAFKYLGLISYEIFLFHQPLIREYNVWAMKNWLGIQEPSREQLLAGITAILALLVLTIAAWRFLRARTKEALFFELCHAGPIVVVLIISAGVSLV